MNLVTQENDNLVEAVMNAAQPLVLFRTSGMIMAAPLVQAYRFDEIEYCTGDKTASCQGTTLKLHNISTVTPGRKPVIVFGDNKALEGLVVDEILDIVAFNGALVGNTQAVAGTARIRGRMTEIVNLSWFANAA